MIEIFFAAGMRSITLGSHFDALSVAAMPAGGELDLIIYSSAARTDGGSDSMRASLEYCLSASANSRFSADGPATMRIFPLGSCRAIAWAADVPESSWRESVA